MQVNSIKLQAGVVFSEGRRVKKGPEPVSNGHCIINMLVYATYLHFTPHRHHHYYHNCTIQVCYTSDVSRTIMEHMTVNVVGHRAPSDPPMRLFGLEQNDTMSPGMTSDHGPGLRHSWLNRDHFQPNKGHE